MKKATLLFFLILTNAVFAQVRINEIDPAQDGTDDGEFIELYTSTPSTSLNGYVLVLYNGNDDKSYDAYDLDGFTTDSNGFLLIGNAGVPGSDLSLSSLQNGPDAVALYLDDATSFPNNTPLTTLNLIDAVVYDSGSAPATNLLAGLGETVQYDEDIHGLKNSESIQYTGNGTFCTGAPTPDLINITCSGSATVVSDIATLKSSVVGGSYMLGGEVWLTYQQNHRNQKYIEDATAAILIDDNIGIITTNYAIGDGITNITGQLVEEDGVLKFVPNSDPGAPTSTGNTLTPQIVTLTQLANAPADYDAELIQVIEASVGNSDPTWIINTAYPLTTVDGAFDFRTSFHDADYIGDQLPTTTVDITGIFTRNDIDSDDMAEYFITARSTADIVENLAVQENTSMTFEMYPNPTKGMLHLKTTAGKKMTVEIYTVFGERVFSNEIDQRTTIDLGTLQAGIYLVKCVQDKQVATKKLIIQ